MGDVLDMPMVEQWLWARHFERCPPAAAIHMATAGLGDPDAAPDDEAAADATQERERQVIDKLMADRARAQFGVE